MSLHPDPDEHILLPLMHGNLAQITRTWIAESLLLGVVHIPDLPLDPLANMSNCSTPAYLFSWKERPQATYNEAVPRRCKETQEAITKSGKAHCTSTKKIGSTCLPDIQTVHQNRHPNKPQPKPQPDLKPASVNQAAITPHTEPKQKVRTKKLVKPPDQPSLLDMNFTKDKPSEIGIVDYETWGHTPVFIDRDSVFRIVLQNPRGLKLSGDLLNTQYSFAICKSMEAGAICLPETNTNWGHKSSHNSLKTLLRKSWAHTTYSVSYTNEELKTINQPGGTANIITNNWTSRVIEVGTDPFGLGRWSYAVLRGAASQKIMIITAFRLCPQSTKTTGATTATAQQFRRLSKAFRDSDIAEDPVPRLQFIADLQAWMESKTSDRYEFILALDANESILDITGSFHPLQYSPTAPTKLDGHDGSLATLIRTCGLCDPLTIHHPDSPPPTTYSRGPNRIDYILVSNSILPAVWRSGLLPFDSIFISDHKPCFIDIDGNSLFREATPNIVPAAKRQLKLQDPRIVKKYSTALQTQLKYHKIQDKEEALMRLAQVTPDDLTVPQRYDKIDTLLTESML